MDSSTRLDTADLYRLLETVENPTARYHIREAIQYAIALEGKGRLGPQTLPRAAPGSGDESPDDEPPADE